jgi:hypothetical protein
MKLPQEIINKIMLYHSTPTADIMHPIIDKYYEACSMRYKSIRNEYKTFFTVWQHIELDQALIDERAKRMKEGYEALNLDF